MSAMGPRKSGRGGCELLTALVAAVAVAAVCAAPAVTASLLAEGEAAALQFAAFKQQYGKAYATPEEEAHRLRVFQENMADAQAMNALNPHATFGVTQFSDLTRDEFEAQYANGAKYFEAATADAPDMMEAVNFTSPTEMDWRQRGAVTPVKNQGECGSCWAFSAIGNVEGQWKIAGRALTTLSEQQMVSCDQSNNGCSGGLMGPALNWVIQRQGGVLYTAASWPYVSGSGRYVPPCYTGGRQVGARIRGTNRVPPDEQQMAAQLSSLGPLAVAVDATSHQHYRGGVITSCIARRITHAVLIVGYSKSANPPYWIIKNSWGTGWGEQGYLRIMLGRNLCLINEYVVTAVV